MQYEMRRPSTTESTYPFPRYYGMPEWLERWEPFRWLAERQHHELPIPVEEYVDGDELVVRAELPDVDPDEDVSMTVSDGVLEITARRRRHKAIEAGHMLRSELRYGTLSRSVRLPGDVAADDIAASYADGMLTIRLPIDRAQAGARRVPIQRA